MYSPETLMTPATGAITSSDFYVGNDPVSIIVTGLSGTETAKLEVHDFTRGAYSTVTLDGVVQSCDVGTNIMIVSAPGRYRINKSATVATVGVTLSR